MSKDFKIPKCAQNECKKDGLVAFNGRCHQMDSVQACKNYYYLIGRKTYLSVSPITQELTCADAEEIYECNDLCCTNNKGKLECFQKQYSKKF